MKLSCDVIKDLLPLYVENITSEDSNQLIHDHLAECPECTAYEQNLKEGITTNTGDIKTIPLKQVQQDILKRKRNSIIFISLIVGLFMLIIFSYITKPHFITKKNSGVTVETSHKNNIYINFSENVTSCKLTSETWEGGQRVVIVEAWTSIWDDILGKSTPSLSIKNVQETVDTIYYCSNREENDTGNMTIIYGTNPNPNGGVVILPRLVMGYYFYLAILLSVVIGVIWLILKNRKKASIICKYLFLVPISYIAAQVLLGVSLISFTAQRDFIMIIISATIIYGICIFGIKLLVQYNRDKQLEFNSENK
ncbi:MAG: zf-HC2 domain-containing protein [Clostridiales bacterium]|nr:zf-HC2 domain-containing protein [Clostridiales bacterium]